MVKWMEFPTREVMDRVKATKVPGEELLQVLSSASKDLIVTFVPKDDLSVLLNFDMKRLLSPLGDYGRMLLREKDTDALADLLAKYWMLKGAPVVLFDTVKAPTVDGDECVTLRAKIVQDETKVNRLRGFLEQGDLGKVGTRLNRFVIGTDGSNLEMQFLAEGMRKESGAEAGDFLDPGIFVSVNGSIKVSAGVHRLICTNGLVDTMHVWQRSSLEFLSNPQMLERGLQLVDWMIGQVGHKVGSVREISIAMGKDYPDAFMNRFWKNWSQKIELGELDWYDVVADLTTSVNGTLGDIRYKALSVSHKIERLKTGCECPVCSAKVQNV